MPSPQSPTVICISNDECSSASALGELQTVNTVSSLARGATTPKCVSRALIKLRSNYRMPIPSRSLCEEVDKESLYVARLYRQCETALEMTVPLPGIQVSQLDDTWATETFRTQNTPYPKAINTIAVDSPYSCASESKIQIYSEQPQPPLRKQRMCKSTQEFYCNYCTELNSDTPGYIPGLTKDTEQNKLQEIYNTQAFASDKPSSIVFTLSKSPALQPPHPEDFSVNNGLRNTLYTPSASGERLPGLALSDSRPFCFPLQPLQESDSESELYSRPTTATVSVTRCDLAYDHPAFAKGFGAFVARKSVVTNYQAPMPFKEQTLFLVPCGPGRWMPGSHLAPKARRLTASITYESTFVAGRLPHRKAEQILLRTTHAPFNPPAASTCNNTLFNSTRVHLSKPVQKAVAQRQYRIDEHPPIKPKPFLDELDVTTQKFEPPKASKKLQFARAAAAFHQPLSGEIPNPEEHPTTLFSARSWPHVTLVSDLSGSEEDKLYTSVNFSDNFVRRISHSPPPPYCNCKVGNISARSCPTTPSRDKTLPQTPPSTPVASEGRDKDNPTQTLKSYSDERVEARSASKTPTNGCQVNSPTCAIKNIITFTPNPPPMVKIEEVEDHPRWPSPRCRRASPDSFKKSHDRAENGSLLTTRQCYPKLHDGTDGRPTIQRRRKSKSPIPSSMSSGEAKMTSRPLSSPDLHPDPTVTDETEASPYSTPSQTSITEEPSFTQSPCCQISHIKPVIPCPVFNFSRTSSVGERELTASVTPQIDINLIPCTRYADKPIKLNIIPGTTSFRQLPNIMNAPTGSANRSARPMTERLPPNPRSTASVERDVEFADDVDDIGSIDSGTLIPEGRPAGQSSYSDSNEVYLYWTAARNGRNHQGVSFKFP